MSSLTIYVSQFYKRISRGLPFSVLSNFSLEKKPLLKEQLNGGYPVIINPPISVNEFIARNCSSCYVFAGCMNYLWIRARYDGIVVLMTFQQFDIRSTAYVMQSNVMPVALVAVPCATRYQSAVFL